MAGRFMTPSADGGSNKPSGPMGSTRRAPANKPAPQRAPSGRAPIPVIDDERGRRNAVLGGPTGIRPSSPQAVFRGSPVPLIDTAQPGVYNRVWSAPIMPQPYPAYVPPPVQQAQHDVVAFLNGVPQPVIDSQQAGQYAPVWNTPVMPTTARAQGAPAPQIYQPFQPPVPQAPYIPPQLPATVGGVPQPMIDTQRPGVYMPVGHGAIMPTTRNMQVAPQEQQVYQPFQIPDQPAAQPPAPQPTTVPGQVPAGRQMGVGAQLVPAGQPATGNPYALGTPNVPVPEETVPPPSRARNGPQGPIVPRSPNTSVGGGNPNGAPPDISEGVRNILNERNWKLPAARKKISMPKGSFDRKSSSDLLEHDYRITPEEWNRIQQVYSSPAAIAAGYRPGKPPPALVDDNMPLLHLSDQESLALTWDAYEKLNSGQRAAVDFNTLLVDAREEDLGNKIDLSKSAQKDYDKQVTQLFGEGRGSDVAAVNTVELLSKLKLDLAGQDLDEYLSLERAIDTTELPDFKFSKGDIKTLTTLVNGPTSYAQVRTPENLAAIDTAGIQQVQQVIKTQLQNPGAVVYDFDTLMNGPDAAQVATPPLGFGDETTKWDNPNDANMDMWFRKGLTMLGSEDLSSFNLPKGSDPMSMLLSDLPKQPGYGKGTQQQFLDYLAGKVSLLGQYGTDEEAVMAERVAKRAGLK